MKPASGCGHFSRRLRPLVLLKQARLFCKLEPLIGLHRATFLQKRGFTPRNYLVWPGHYSSRCCLHGYPPPRHYIAKNIHRFCLLYAKEYFASEQILHLTPLHGHFILPQCHFHVINTKRLHSSQIKILTLALFWLKKYTRKYLGRGVRV